MKRRALLTCIAALVPALVLTIAFLLLETVQAEPGTQKQEGISYAAWWPGQYSQPDADLALANLGDAGANWISLIVTQYQDDIYATEIQSTTATPTDSDLIHVIEQAHSLGLKVMLKPHLDLASDPEHWRGQIGQYFTETEWNTWFTSYQGFISHYAQLAQTYGADQFCVGTELSASEGRATNWRAVITGIRSNYSGPLTYAANHGDETDITWWDAVDYVGVDAYYPLTGESDPTVAELKTAWQPLVSTLGTLASNWNRPILFTEIGYRSQDGTTQHPWDWQSGGEVDLQEQADAYQAAFESVFNQPWFAGMYWWAWETDPFQGGPCDDGYTPYDKPAEEVLRYWYGAPPRVSKPTPQPDYSRTMDVYTDGLNPGWENWSWDADVDLSSDDPVHSGTQAISITAQAWGALSLHHSNFDSTPYYWLEFYVRKSSVEQQLRAFANDENDSELRYRPVDDCRYTDEQPIVPGAWTRVRIPLSHLDASGRPLQRVSIKNWNSQPSSFWVDEIRLVGASWRVHLPLVLKPQPQFKDQITRLTVTLPQPLEEQAGSFCTWGHCSISPRLYHEPLPDDRTLVGWTDSSENGHITVISGASTERTFDFPGRSIRGLVGHDNGTFAVLLWNSDSNVIWLSKRRDNGSETWTTNLNGDGTFPEFWLGDGRLGYGNGLYIAYFTVQSDSGHYGDQLTYVDDSGDIQEGGWGWGCSHSMGQLVGYHPDLDQFVAVCSSDCYPDKGLFVNHSHQVYEADGSCSGSVSAQLGQIASAEGSWKLLFNALDRPCCEGHGIALATIGENYESSYTWLTNTDGSYERDPVIARLGTDPAVERYLAGWTTTNDGRYWMGVIDGEGSFSVGPEDVTPIGVTWGNRDDSLRTRADGTVSWIQGDATTRQLHLFRFDGSVYVP